MNKDELEELNHWSEGNWLKQTVARGLAGLLTLRLDGTPPEDVIAKTAAVWYSVIKNWPINWNREQDQERLLIAFRQLMGQSTCWPAPARLRLLLPQRKPQTALPAPAYPREQAQKNLAEIKRMMLLIGKTQAQIDEYQRMNRWRNAWLNASALATSTDKQSRSRQRYHQATRLMEDFLNALPH